jgi:hypothetical protein
MLKSLASIVPFPTLENDGMVDFDSCSVGLLDGETSRADRLDNIIRMEDTLNGKVPAASFEERSFMPWVTDAEGQGHYKAMINHADATFQNGDGWWGSDRKPVRWFECAL